MADPIVIVGASLTGATAAATLRDEGYGGELVLVGAERHLPYERPPLSKQYLRGEQPFEAQVVHPADWYTEQRIELLLETRARALQPAERRVELEGGRRLRYDRLLLATGGQLRRLEIPGANLPGVLGLRTVEDADRLRSEAVDGRRIAIVGMGFIGSEVAASLRKLGAEVTVVAADAGPLQRAVGPIVSKVLEDVHHEHGVEMWFNERAQAFEGTGRVSGVRTSRGRLIGCDVVLVAGGIEPADGLAREAGLAVENGVITDARCRTADARIFAAGDVANWPHPVFGMRLRVEHWQNAQRHGAAAARAMLGSEAPYDEVPWFWSEQYDITIQWAGPPLRTEDVIVRGDPTARHFAAFFLRDGRILSATAVNLGRDVRRAMPLIKAAVAVDRALLRDEAIDLRELAPAVHG